MTRLRPEERLIVALDAPSVQHALALARRLRGTVKTVKIGSILFTAAGPDVLRRVRALGFGVMLDLKFHDIPHTVELSCRAAVHHRVSLLTVHACGEPAMLEAAASGVRQEARRLGVARPLVFGVTVLTSVAGASTAKTRAEVLRRARAAVAAGCDGVVASAQEAKVLRARFGRRLRIICPGIRPAQSAGRDDQRRVSTPAAALADGADWLVVGRPITGAANPRAAARMILHEMEGVYGC